MALVARRRRRGERREDDRTVESRPRLQTPTDSDRPPRTRGVHLRASLRCCVGRKLQGWGCFVGPRRLSVPTRTGAHTEFWESDSTDRQRDCVDVRCGRGGAPGWSGAVAGGGAGRRSPPAPRSARAHLQARGAGAR